MGGRANPKPPSRLHAHRHLPPPSSNFSMLWKKSGGGAVVDTGALSGAAANKKPGALANTNTTDLLNQRVEVKALTENTEFNGKRGTAIEYQSESGSYKLKLDDGKEAVVLRANLIKLEAAILAGHEGTVNVKYMGTYICSANEANGAPLYVMQLGFGGKYWLYRMKDDGRWMLTDEESSIAQNRGPIVSSRAAELPSEVGLTWKHYDGSAWQDDPKMTCTTQVHALASQATPLVDGVTVIRPCVIIQPLGPPAPPHPISAVPSRCYRSRADRSTPTLAQNIR